MAETRAVVSNRPLPPALKGDLNKIFRAMVDRIIVTLPFGAPQIVFGGTQPTTNVGLWMKGGTKPYVWDENIPGYTPADISDSLIDPFTISATEPDAPVAGEDPFVWLRVSSGATVRGLGLYYYNGTDWVPFAGIPNSGATADRPADPLDLEQYFDTDINALIHWERSAWRTVSGSPGDLKFVDTGGTDYTTVLADALTRNPGWEEAPIAYRGRATVIAGTGAGLTARAPLDSFGAEEVVLDEGNLPPHTHDTTLQVFEDEADLGTGVDYIVASGGGGTTDVTSSSVGSSDPVAIVQPSIAFVAIRKQ